MIKITFDKYGKIRNLDFGDEVIFKGNNRVNQIFVSFDDMVYNPNHYMTYSALINENDYEGNLTDLATAKTTIDGVEGYTFYLFSNLTAKAGELKLSVRLVDRTSERVLVSGIIPLVIEDTAISTYASVDITKTQYNALLTAFDELSQSIDATNFKTINGESIYGEGDIVVLTGDYMKYYVNQQISNVYDSIDVISSSVVELQQSNAKLNAIIEKQEKKIKQLELASEGNVLATITEGDSAYEVDVGVDTLPYATIDKLGGMTYKSENNLRDSKVTEIISRGANLLDFDDVPATTTNGITYSIKDGVITLNGTATSTFNIVISSSTFDYQNLAMAYFVDGTISHNLLLQRNVNGSWAQTTINKNGTAIWQNEKITGFRFQFYGTYSYTNVKIKLMLVKGTTAPTTFKPYKQPTAIAIPTAIQNLDGYGQSNFEDNNEYNYIDFENKKFIRYGYYEGETWKPSYLETDIAEFLQDDVIEVESGGTLTFENEYKQNVPFTWTFQEKL